MHPRNYITMLYLSSESGPACNNMSAINNCGSVNALFTEVIVVLANSHFAAVYNLIGRATRRTYPLINSN